MQVGILITIVSLVLIVSDYAANSSKGASWLQSIGKVFFGTHRKALIAYELMTIGMLLVWVVPALWVDLGYPGLNIGYVLLMTLGIPPVVYVIINERFKPKGEITTLLEGDMLEETIEAHYHKNQLEDFVRHIEEEATKDDVVQSEYENTKKKLLSRTDEVGLAYQEVIEKLHMNTKEVNAK